MWEKWLLCYLQSDHKKHALGSYKENLYFQPYFSNLKDWSVCTGCLPVDMSSPKLCSMKSCSGTYPVTMWVSPGMETTQHLWASWRQCFLSQWSWLLQQEAPALPKFWLSDRCSCCLQPAWYRTYGALLRWAVLVWNLEALLIPARHDKPGSLQQLRTCIQNCIWIQVTQSAAAYQEKLGILPRAELNL